MPARYTSLPNPRSIPNPDTELNEAFGSDQEDESESTPLTRKCSAQEPVSSCDDRGSIPGAYDFEREYTYDYPPPGSPPHPTTFARPNDIGNSNGQLPSSPVRVPAPKLSFFRKAAGAILPMYYTHSASSGSRARGGGIENDGVFANVTAKPQRANVVHTEDGEVLMVPEDTQKDVPPSYADAQLDSVPPYWETTVHAPPGLNFGSDMIIDDLPSGSLLTFALNLVASYFFQLVGFLLTYLLHTSHAGKYGSRAGLGLTLIQYGFYSRNAPNIVMEESDMASGEGPFALPPGTIQPSDPPSHSQPIASGGLSSREWVAFFLMALGWFLLLTSTAGFWRVKRWERSIRSTDAGPITAEDIERDIAVRRNLETIFGIPEHERVDGAWIVQRNEHGDDIVIPDRTALEDARMTRQLAAAGLI